MKITYTREVVTPEHLAGKVGDTKELPDGEAARLVSEGYAVEEKGKGKKNEPA